MLDGPRQASLDVSTGLKALIVSHVFHGQDVDARADLGQKIL